MSTQSEQLEQTVCGVSAGNLPIFDCPNCNQPVLLPTPVHGNVHNPPVPWHLLCPIEPLPPQENILQAAMQLAEPRFPCFWHPPMEPLAWQEAIVQLAEVIHHQCNVEGGGVSSCVIENVSGESVPVTSRF